MFHTVRFTDLEPETQYLYRVGDGANWSEWLEFTTASDKPKPFSFVYFGDAQNDIKEHWSRVVRQAFTDAPDAEFIVHAGDLINTSVDDTEWGEWYHAGGWIGGDGPEHRHPGQPRVQRHAEPVLATRLRVPAERPAGHGGALRGDEGDRLLRRLPGRSDHLAGLELRRCRRRHRGWSTSRPSGWRACSPTTRTSGPWSRSTTRCSPTSRRATTRLYGTPGSRSSRSTTSIWCCRATTTATGAGTSGPASPASRARTVYVVSVSGPKMYGADASTGTRTARCKKMLRDTQLFQLITLDGDKLSYKSKDANGELYDDFTITKPANGPKVITENLDSRSRRAWAARRRHALARPRRRAEPGRLHPGRGQGLRASVPVKITTRPLTPRCRSSIRRRPAPASSSTARSRSSSRCRPR